MVIVFFCTEKIAYSFCQQEVRIYKSKQEVRGKKRKHALDQETDQENESLFLFFFVESAFSFFLLFFLDRFLGRKRVFLYSYFHVFIYEFPPNIAFNFEDCLEC